MLQHSRIAAVARYSRRCRLATAIANNTNITIAIIFERDCVDAITNPR